MKKQPGIRHTWTIWIPAVAFVALWASKNLFLFIKVKYTSNVKCPAEKFWLNVAFWNPMFTFAHSQNAIKMAGKRKEGKVTRTINQSEGHQNHFTGGKRNPLQSYPKAVSSERGNPRTALQQTWKAVRENWSEAWGLQEGIISNRWTDLSQQFEHTGNKSVLNT